MKSRLMIMPVLAFAFIAVLAFTSCKKEGIGGDSEIAFHVKHHDDAIPFAKVYIKYGATEFPGATLSEYDDSTTTDSEAHGHFHELIKGDYYLYGVGYDSAVSEVVKGGIGVNLKAKTDYETDIAVTE